MTSSDIGTTTVEIWYQTDGGAATYGATIPHSEWSQTGEHAADFTYVWWHNLQRGSGSRSAHQLWLYAYCGEQEDWSDWEPIVSIFQMVRPAGTAGVTSPYGHRTWEDDFCDPNNKCSGSDFHTGVDFDCSYGTPVVAAEDGSAGWHGQVSGEYDYPMFCYRQSIWHLEPGGGANVYGYEVWLSHGPVHKTAVGLVYTDITNLTSVYRHLLPNGRAQGQISQGTTAGNADTTGENYVRYDNPPYYPDCAVPAPNPRWESSSSGENPQEGSHLHFEVWEDGTNVSPLAEWVW